MRFISSLIFVSILIVGCNNPVKSDLQPGVSEFEKVLGEKKTKELNKIVAEFEDLLKANYKVKNDVEALRTYIKEINDSGVFVRNELIEDLIIKRFKESSLIDEIWLKPDSCWQNENRSVCRYIYKDTIFENSFVNKNGVGNSSSDSILFNKNGIYFQGLLTAKDDKYVVDYLQKIEIAGIISPSILVGGFSQESTDFSNYFVKRFVLVDIFLKDFKW